MDAFVKHLITTGPPEAFFDDQHDEHLSQVLVENDLVDKAEEHDAGGPDEKLSEKRGHPVVI